MSDRNEEYVNINGRGGRGNNAGASKKNGSSAPRLSAKKEKTKGGILALRIVSIVLAVICLVGACGLLFGDNLLNSINYKDVDQLDSNNSSDKTLSTAAPLEEHENGQQEFDENALLKNDGVLNIMLYGTDNAASLSDTMILLSIDSVHQKLKMTSFLRDTYVAIPTVGAHKLNYAYAVGGAALSMQTIEQNYGVKIDKYAMVTFDAFKDIVDILGGVTVELSDDEIGYINMQVRHNGQSEEHIIYESAGPIKLNGQQALWYARNRGEELDGYVFYGDDWDRTDRQRKFLSAVVDGLKDASLTELISIMNSIGPMITTNMSKSNILDYILPNILSIMNYEIEECSMPCDGLWSYGRNHAGSVILVNDWNAARLELAKFIYEEAVVQ